MRKLCLSVILISCMVMLSCGGTADRSQPKPLTGSVKDFERAQFDDPTHINNRWMPLKPGTQRVYEGSAILDGEKQRSTRRVVSTVTNLGKMIAGVQTLVIWERDYTAGELGESEIAFFAQDNAGNVWLLGEYPEEYENRKFVEAPVWIAGQKDARAGIAMLADPRLGRTDYSQGFAPPPADFTDRARIYEMGQQTCTPVDCYKNVLVSEEFNPDEPGAYQLKYYASEVGNVRVGWRGAKEEEKETLALVKRQQLSSKELEKARKTALKLDKRAYERRELYRKLQPAKPL